MILAVLAALTLGTQTADAQIFQFCQTPCVCYRVGFFQRCRAWRRPCVANYSPATTCNGPTCGAEYVPTTEGNVPAHEYLNAKTGGLNQGATNGSGYEDQPRGEREPGSSGLPLAAANRIRARYGLPTLTLDANLCDGSARQANYCASVGALIHGAGVAEILAMNSSGFDSALNQWLASPAHRAILLSGQYRVAGVAVVRDRNGRVWCAMRFR